MTAPRSWLKRPLVAPPNWGRSLPDIWKDTEVTFSRVGAPVPDDFGGFKPGGGLAPFLTVRAKVYPDTVTGGADLVSGTVRRTIVRALIDFDDIPNPDDLPMAGLVPDKGDTMTYTDALGETFTLLVNRVLNPGEANDHLEVESEVFD